MEKLLANPGRDVLQKLSWDELHKAGHYLAYAKKNYPDLYNAKFKEKFGYLPDEKPKKIEPKKPTFPDQGAKADRQQSVNAGNKPTAKSPFKKS